jgi:hypothetical protein
MPSLIEGLLDDLAARVAPASAVWPLVFARVVGTVERDAPKLSKDIQAGYRWSWGRFQLRVSIFEALSGSTA